MESIAPDEHLGLGTSDGGFRYARGEQRLTSTGAVILHVVRDALHDLGARPVRQAPDPTALQVVPGRRPRWPELAWGALKQGARACVLRVCALARARVCVDVLVCWWVRCVLTIHCLGVGSKIVPTYLCKPSPPPANKTFHLNIMFSDTPNDDENVKKYIPLPLSQPLSVCTTDRPFLRTPTNAKKDTNRI